MIEAAWSLMETKTLLEIEDRTLANLFEVGLADFVGHRDVVAEQVLFDLGFTLLRGHQIAKPTNSEESKGRSRNGTRGHGLAYSGGCSVNALYENTCQYAAACPG